MFPILLSSVVWLTVTVFNLNPKTGGFQPNHSFLSYKTDSGSKSFQMTSDEVANIICKNLQKGLIREEYKRMLLTSVIDRCMATTGIGHTIFDRERTYTSVTDNRVPRDLPSETLPRTEKTDNGSRWWLEIPLNEQLMLFSLIIHLIFNRRYQRNKTGLFQILINLRDFITEESRTKKIIADKENRLNVMAREIWALELIDRLQDRKLDQKWYELNDVYQKLEELHLQKYPKRARKDNGDTPTNTQPNPPLVGNSATSNERQKHGFNQSWYRIRAVQGPVLPLVPPVVSRRRPQNRK